MAYTSDTGGGGQGAPDFSGMPTASGMGGMLSSSSSVDDSLFLKVYVGKHTIGHEKVDPRQQKVNEELGIPYSPASVTQSKFNIATLMAQFDQFSHKQFLHWRDRLSDAGYSVGSGSALEVRDAYQAMLTDVATRQMSIEQGGTGRSFLTPEKYLNELIRMGGGGKGSGKTKSKTTSITKNIYALDPGEARTIMTKTLQQYLGRDPTADEVRDFVDAVNMSAKEDPTVQKKVTKYVKRPDGSLQKVTTTGSTVSTGYTSDDAMWEAIDEAKASPDYGSYQAVSTYMPVVEDVLNSVV